VPRYWWVNHKQTLEQEIDGQYLWSPKRIRGERRNVFYDNMRRASPGDVVLSYANQRIGYIGRVADFAFTAPKPSEFGETGANWSQEGWLLPIYWTPLERPVRPRDFIEVLGPLLPARYSPIRPDSGHGNQGAYLAEISEPAFREVAARTAFSREALSSGGANSLTYRNVRDRVDEAVQRQIESDATLDETVKESVILARRGQGAFRSHVQEVERACRVTGVTNPALLIASHIKPWRSCGTAHERLDGMNGLMLTPDVDLLFDRGFISFRDDGRAEVSPRVDPDDLRRLGLQHLTWQELGLAEEVAPWQIAGFAPRQCDYLAYHRAQVFIS
jgi:hypothetical protein